MSSLKSIQIDVPEGFEIAGFDQAKGVISFKAKPAPLMGRIKTFDDVCQEMGKDPEYYETDSDDPEDIYLNGLSRLMLITKLFRQGVILDTTDNKQKKWYPWFDVEKSSSNPTGFRFNYSFCALTATASVLGPLLCLQSSEVSDYVGKTFLEEYRVVAMVKEPLLNQL